jgi:hypothetical protein
LKTFFSIQNIQSKQLFISQGNRLLVSAKIYSHQQAENKGEKFTAAQVLRSQA